MTKSKRILSSALLLTFVLSAGMASGQRSHSGAEELKKYLDKHYEMRNKFKDEMKNKGVPKGGKTYRMAICVAGYTVDYIYPIGDPHLNLNERFAVAGPFPWIDAFLVLPLSASAVGAWDHSWKENLYIATPSAWLGWYDLKPVGVKPHLVELERDHEYVIRPRNPNKDNCPTYIDFQSICHVGSCPERHPGHAGANMD
ncbi:MAG: hypothetical protein KJO31_18075 [Gammaproteobacteria bacterium]|nr:hypothetical protein [Gammaproteobacteria bacterium]